MVLPIKNIRLASCTLIAFIALSLCSVKAAAQQLDHLEMVVYAADTWSYFIGLSEPPSNWNDINFNDSVWAKGQGGIGYGDNDDRTQIVKTFSLYLRKNFSITDSSEIIQGILSIDFDDAFVAYLNGHEIARANIGVIGDKPKYNSLALFSNEAHIPDMGNPETFIIDKDTLNKYLYEGENTLAIQVHNVSFESSDLSSTTFFFVGVSNEAYNYRNIPDWFAAPNNDKSGLPLLLIDTDGKSILDEPKVGARLKVISNDDGINSVFDTPTDYDGDIAIEVRGQTSKMFPKKSYSFEIRNTLGEGIDTSLLGLPAHEDWVLYAPFSDKTLLRNALTYHLGGDMGRWQPRFKYCEVYLNGNYQGVYFLVEAIKRGKNRVDISKLAIDEIEGEDLTGGYIVKVDKIYDLSPSEYFTPHANIRYGNASDYIFSYVYPRANRIVQQQKDYINNFITGFENVLNGWSFKNPETGYQKYIDVNSFVDFQIINELTNNPDGYRISTFFYKEKDTKGGKLFAGPLWDFNLGYGNVNYLPLNERWDTWLYPRYGPGNYDTMHWWARLMEDPEYSNRLYYRWKELREGAFHNDTIMAYIDSSIEYLGESINRNFDTWRIMGKYVWPNNYVGPTYESEVDFLKTWIVNRLNWMDNNILLSTGVANTSIEKTDFLAYPNPLAKTLNIKLDIDDLSMMHIEIVNVNGLIVLNRPYYPKNTGGQSINIDVQSLKHGVYMLRIKQNSSILRVKKLLKVE